MSAIPENVHEYLVYEAARGERNRVVARYSDGGSSVRVSDTAGLEAGSGCAMVAQDTAECSVLESFGDLWQLGDRDDRLRLTGRPYAKGAAPLVMDGSGDDLVRGSAGDDSFISGPGADRLFGGSGNDVFEGRLGRDRLALGTGADRATGGRLVRARDGRRDRISGCRTAIVDRKDRVLGCTLVRRR